MSTKPDGGPAFPQNDAAVNRINNHDGMSLRDWFAAVALHNCHHNGSVHWLASEAYRLADAMLEARQK